MRLSTQSVQTHLSNKQGKNSHGKLKDFKLPTAVSIIIAVIAGAIFSFSLAPYYYWVLAIISPAVLYALLLPEMSNKKAFCIGQSYGVGLWFVGAFWLYNSIHNYGNISMPLAILAILAMALLMGVFHGTMAVVFNRFMGKQPLAFASVWVLQEWLKTWVLTGFPWLFIGYAFTEQYWLSVYAPIFGVFFLSFIVILLSAGLVETFRSKAQYFAGAMVVIIVGVILAFIDPAWTTKKQVKPLKVSLLQGNIPQDLKWQTEYIGETLSIYATLSDTEWDQDLIVWPESSIPVFQTDAWGFITQVANKAYTTKTTWVTGIPFKDVSDYDSSKDLYEPFYNSIVALGYDAEGIYKKQRLVPFGEYIPFEGALNLFPQLANSQSIMSYRRGGDDQGLLNVQGHNMGSAICYEVAYPETTRKNAQGSDFLLTISNDAWFDDSTGPWQHLQMVQMRSLETGRWFLRSTNNGITAIINEKGQIVKKLPQFKRTVLRGEVEPRIGKTPFMIFGQYPILLLTMLLTLLSILGHRAKLKALYGQDKKSSIDIKQINTPFASVREQQEELSTEPQNDKDQHNDTKKADIEKK